MAKKKYKKKILKKGKIPFSIRISTAFLMTSVTYLLGTSTGIGLGGASKTNIVAIGGSILIGLFVYIAMGYELK